MSQLENNPESCPSTGNRWRDQWNCVPCQIRYMVIMFLLFLMAALSGCDEGKVYEENKEITDYIWNQDDKKSFAFEITDTTQRYNVLTNIRHTTFYPNSNIWLMAYTTYPDGTEQEQRLQLLLAEPSGKWYGECAGEICDVQQFIQQNVRFNQVGTYAIAFEQIMRTDNLPGVMAIGLRVEQVGE